jgi:aspartyl-tRNA(Asn)/glutamyl-tRNA(Gln) amidotransferase subunit C
MSTSDGGPAKRAAITTDDVAHIGRLARLDLSPEETVSLTHDLTEILGYVEKIAAIETGAADADAGSLPPLAPIVGTGEPVTPMRADTVGPSLPVAEALRPSADHDGDFFRVPPVIDREEA